MTDNIVANIQVLESGRYKTAFGFIVFPIINCDLAAIEQAESSMDLMLAFTVGKSVQSALLVTPVLLIVAWGLGMDDLNLGFDLSEACSLFLSVFLLMRLTCSSTFTW